VIGESLRLRDLGERSTDLAQKFRDLADPAVLGHALGNLLRRSRRVAEQGARQPERVDVLEHIRVVDDIGEEAETSRGQRTHDRDETQARFNHVHDLFVGIFRLGDVEGLPDDLDSEVTFQNFCHVELQGQGLVRGHGLDEVAPGVDGVYGVDPYQAFEWVGWLEETAFHAAHLSGEDQVVVDARYVEADHLCLHWCQRVSRIVGNAVQVN
jgi:hypothetical protein